MKDDEMTLDDIQQEVAIWSERRNPLRTRHTHRNLAFFRVVTSLGDLAGAVFDFEDEGMKDADSDSAELRATLGGVVVWLAEYASRHGWNLREEAERVWREMRGPDFVKHPGVGRPRKGEGR